MKFFKKQQKGFTLIEVMVAVTIIALLSAVLFSNFNDARKQSRDKARMAALKQLQLSLELYKAQNGVYPAQGCGSGSDFAGPGPESDSGLASCATYITLLAPDFISELPRDPKFENEENKGFYYRVDASGTSYKAMIRDSVEILFITSESDEFARCPAVGGSGGCSSAVPATTYAIYGGGAGDW